MDWEEIFKLISAVLLSVGGAGTLIWIISKGLAKAMFERYMEKVKFKYDEELTSLKACNDNLIFISNIQYEKEFNIYQKIWLSMFECIVNTGQLYPQGMYYRPPSGKELDDFLAEKHKKWAESYNAFLKDLIAYEPFFENNVYEKMNEIRLLCLKVGSIHEREEFRKKDSPTFAMVRNEPMSSEDNNFVWVESHELLEKLRSEVKTQIQIYLKSTKIKHF